MKINFQKYLVEFFNNPLGRWYLGSPKGKHIAKITPTGCHYFTGELSKRNGLPVICTGDRSPGQRDIIRQKIMRLASVISFFAFLPFFPASLLPLIALTDTGWKSPTATGGRMSQWVNGDRAYSSNDEYCTVYLEAGTQYQSWEEFDFGVPEEATIEGVEVSCEAKSTVDDSLVYVNWWCESDDIGSDGKQTLWNIAEATHEVGASDDLWGRTPIATDFSNANFSVYIRTFKAYETLSLDHIQVKVYYTSLLQEKSVSDSGSGAEEIGVENKVEVKDKNVENISHF